jgi:hypothetical protein
MKKILLGLLVISAASCSHHVSHPRRLPSSLNDRIEAYKDKIAQLENLQANEEHYIFLDYLDAGLEPNNRKSFHIFAEIISGEGVSEQLSKVVFVVKEKQSLQETIELQTEQVGEKLFLKSTIPWRPKLHSSYVRFKFKDSTHRDVELFCNRPKLCP